MRSPGSDRSIDPNLAPKPAYARGGAVGHVIAGRRPPAWTTDLPRDGPALLWLLALAVAAVYLVLFVAQLPRNITELGWNSGYASGFTLPETLVRTGSGGATTMGSSGQWVSLWFGLLTARLPLHRALWGVAPTLLFVLSALAVGWSVRQVAGRRAAVLAVLIGVVASPLALAFLMAAVAHNTVYPCTALLGAYLIWLARGDGRRRLAAVAVPPLVGIVVGTCLASDTLLAATGVIPLGLTALLAGARRERRSRVIALSALVTVAVAIPVALVTSAIMRSLGFLTLRTPITLAPLSELPERAALLFKGLRILFNGYLGPEEPGTLHTPLGIASDVVMSAALLALVIVGAVTTIRLISSGLRRHEPQSATELARSLHVVYWVASAATACGAFWLAAETGGNTNVHESYYATVILSVAAVIPLLLSGASPARWLIPAGAAVFFAAGVVGLTGNYTNISGWVQQVAPGITRFARANHVTSGYSGYWLASSLTWNTHERVAVRPLMECSNPEGASACPFYIATVPSWYVPRQRHTFLLVDSEEDWIRALPRGLGPPLASDTIGAVHMYIYPYDIASRLGPAPY
jgi:hypothetical protein